MDRFLKDTYLIQCDKKEVRWLGNNPGRKPSSHEDHALKFVGVQRNMSIRWLAGLPGFPWGWTRLQHWLNSSIQADLIDSWRWLWNVTFQCSETDCFSGTVILRQWSWTSRWTGCCLKTWNQNIQSLLLITNPINTIWDPLKGRKKLVLPFLFGESINSYHRGEYIWEPQEFVVWNLNSISGYHYLYFSTCKIHVSKMPKVSSITNPVIRLWILVSVSGSGTDEAPY